MYIKSKALTVLVLLVLIFLNFSCVKLEEKRQTGIISEKLPQTDSIPLAWGKLISVSTVQNWAQLWFQDEEGNIRMIPYNVPQNRLLSEAKVIRRSQ